MNIGAIQEAAYNAGRQDQSVDDWNSWQEEEWYASEDPTWNSESWNTWQDSSSSWNTEEQLQQQQQQQTQQQPQQQPQIPQQQQQQQIQPQFQQRPQTMKTSSIMLSPPGLQQQSTRHGMCAINASMKPVQANSQDQPEQLQQTK